MNSPSESKNSHSANSISKILDPAGKLIKTVLEAINLPEGSVRLKVYTVIMLLAFVILVVFICIYRNDLKGIHVVFAIVFCSFFLIGAVFPLLILKKDTGHDNGIVVERRSLNDIVKSVEKSFLISGHTLRKFTKETERDEVKDVLNLLWGKRVDVTIIFLHPESPYAEAHQPFHPGESIEIQTEKEKYKNQIQEAIKYCMDKGRDQTNCCVYLSYYKPPFRTIVVDYPEFCFSSEPSASGIESWCYIDLYMYGVDVKDTPRIRFREKSKGYEKIVHSIKELLSSCHVVPLVEKGEINENWKDRGLFHILDVCAERKCHKKCKLLDLISSALLGNQNPSHPHSGIYREDYKAGTFTLRQFEQSFDQYKHLLVENGESSFEEWLDKAVRKEFSDLIDKSTGLSGEIFSKYNDEKTKNEIIEKVKATFEIGPSSFDLLGEIWCQEYSDVIRRMILTYVLGNPDCEIEICGDLTSRKNKEVILTVIEHLSIDYATVDNKEQIWLDLSVIAGLLGLNIKPNRTATSVIKHDIGIDIIEDEAPEVAAERIANELKRIQAGKSQNKSVVDHSKEFFKILKEAREEITLVSFPDDCLETLFLLKFYDFLMDKYKTKLKIHIVPRSVRCGNDVVVSDIKDVLDRFPNLRNNHKHFNVVEDGPKIGGVNLRRIDKNIAEKIGEADIIDVRGARNYEMMQGVNRRAFFGFMVARQISEALTGLPQSENSFFFGYRGPNDDPFIDGWEEALRKEG